jgi:hypothetical protein
VIWESIYTATLLEKQKNNKKKKNFNDAMKFSLFSCRTCVLQSTSSLGGAGAESFSVDADAEESIGVSSGCSPILCWCRNSLASSLLTCTISNL